MAWVQADIGITLIVRQNDHDVGLRGVRRRRTNKGRDCQNERKEQVSHIDLVGCAVSMSKGEVGCPLSNSPKSGLVTFLMEISSICPCPQLQARSASESTTYWLDKRRAFNHAGISGATKSPTLTSPLPVIAPSIVLPEGTLESVRPTH